MSSQTKKRALKTEEISKHVDLVFTFKYACISCIVPKDYDEEEKINLLNTVKNVSRLMFIDKSYVEFKGNKHEDTFMLEDGWNKLCDLVIKTKNGKKATKLQAQALNDAYSMMMLCYTYLFLENLGYDTAEIALTIDAPGKYMVEVQEDTVKEWKYYPGKWQDWN